MSVWGSTETWAEMARIVRTGWSEPDQPMRIEGAANSLSAHLDREASRAVMERTAALDEQESLGMRNYRLSVDPDGSFVAEVAEEDDFGYGGSLTAVLVEGAVPGPYRQLPWAVKAPEAEEDMAAIRAAGLAIADGQPGSTPEEIAELERASGVTIAPALRELWLAVRKGDFPVGEVDEEAEDFDEDFVFQITPPSVQEWAHQQARRQFRDWPYDGRRVLDPRTDDVVQSLIGAPTWIPFADDGGGNVYCVDYTPGPQGQIGQVVQRDHEQPEGARLVAHSLTDFLRGRWVQPTYPSATSGERHSRRLDLKVGDEVRVAGDIEVLQINEGDGTLDLDPFRTCRFLRTVAADPGTLADPLQLLDIGVGALEYLDLSVADWTVLLDSGRLLPRLLAATITPGEGDSQETVSAIANRIRAAYGVPEFAPEVLRTSGTIAG